MALDPGSVDGIVNYIWDKYQGEGLKEGDSPSPKRVCATALRHTVESQVVNNIQLHKSKHQYFMF